MKHAVRFAISLLAAGGLLGSVASHATDLAELPLKSSVLAKPNVIFGLDDSSSMDGEVMLATNDGAFWWDYNAASGWDSTGAPWFNSVGTATTQWRKMVYLFPNGTGSGTSNDVRVLNDATNDHFAIPPTAQFAFLRSAAYNPLYYDPTVTYSPWSPGYVNGATKTFAAATKTAARSHPVYPLTGTASTMDLTNTVAASTTANFTFTGLPGMQLPGTARVCASTCTGAWPLVSSKGWTQTTSSSGIYTVPASTKWNVSMDYFPATYYLKDSTCTVDGSTCVSAPDGSKLKRYEIKSANYTTTALYDAAMQNFANWWTYYRKRKLMLSGAMGKVLEPLTGLRMGIVVFNSQSNVTMYDTDVTSASLNRLKVTGLFYETNGSGGTPTRETLKYIGDQFGRTDRITSGGPYSVVQYACQRNNAFIVTDGFANASTVSVPSYQSGKSSATYGYGTAPYETIYSSSLADLALRYYTNNARTDITATGKVPTTPNDTNRDLHVNTYGLTLGAKGTIYTGNGTPAPTTTSAWPNPNTDRNPTSVDDLWHATINGRGQMYTAATPTETAAKVQAGLNDMLFAVGAQGGVAVSTVNLTAGDGKAYIASYNPSGWSGDLTANPINATTGAISTTATWSASTLLTARTWSNRVIASATASGGVGFTEAGVGTLVNPGSLYGTTSQVMDYLRGDRTLEGTSFRARTSLLGGVINAEPVISYDDKVVYMASGEGMLHAFDIKDPDLSPTDAGKELWAFVPRAVLPDIGQTVARGYTFKTQLDGTPVVAKTGTSSKLLVAGMGAAGRGYYAIDVSTPRTLTETTLASAYKWEFPSASDTTTQAKVGQTVGKPIIVKTANDGYVVLVTSGYNSTADGLGRLWMLDVTDGHVIQEFVTTGGTLTAENGLAHISAYAEDDGTTRWVYGGDLLGNLWRFDLDTKVAPNKLAVLKNAAGVLQSVTAAPELAFVNNRRLVIVGTGRLLDITDFGKSDIQSMYAISDPDTAVAAIDPARGSLQAQTYTRSTDTITSNTVDWSTKRGWYMDLPSGEQANTHPTIAYGGVTFVTNVTGSTDCSASSYLYLLDLGTGGRATNATYVSQQLWSDANATGLNVVLDASGNLRAEVRSYDGSLKAPQLLSKPPIDPKKNSWREVRKE